MNLYCCQKCMLLIHYDWFSCLQDILRCYTKTHSVNEKRIIEGTPCHAILSVKPKLQANFELHDKAEPESKRLGLLRFVCCTICIVSNLLLGSHGIQSVTDMHSSVMAKYYMWCYKFSGGNNCCIWHKSSTCNIHQCLAAKHIVQQ